MSYHNEDGELVNYNPDLLEPLPIYIRKLAQRIVDVRWDSNGEADTRLLQQHLEQAIADMHRGVKFHVKF